MWAHVLGLARPARYAAAFVVDALPTQPPLWLSSPASDQKVIGTVDDEWRIDRISHEVQTVLGYLPEDLAGKQPLSSINPHDLPQVLTGLAHVHATGRNAVVRLRVRRADGRWLWCRAHLSAMGEAPRFAFTLRPLSPEKIPDAERLSALEGRLAKIAQEVRSVAFPVPSTEAPVLAEIPELSNLTSREWQTLSLFADGGRVAGHRRASGAEPEHGAQPPQRHLQEGGRRLAVRAAGPATVVPLKPPGRPDAGQVPSASSSSCSSRARRTAARRLVTSSFRYTWRRCTLIVLGDRNICSAISALLSIVAR